MHGQAASAARASDPDQPISWDHATNLLECSPIRLSQDLRAGTYRASFSPIMHAHTEILTVPRQD